MRPLQKIGLGLLGSIGVIAAPLRADTVVVSTSGFTFVPADVTINVGDSVDWIGLDGGLHTVAEVDDDTSLIYNGGFHSTPIFADSFTHMFNTPGLYYYICEPHGDIGMRGTVTVNAAPIPVLGPLGLAALMSLVLSTGGVVLYRRRLAIA